MGEYMSRTDLTAEEMRNALADYGGEPAIAFLADALNWQDDNLTLSDILCEVEIQLQARGQ